MQPAPLTGPRRVSALAPCVELHPSAVVPPQPTIRPFADGRTPGANASGETSRCGDTHGPEPGPQPTIRLPATLAGATPGFGNGGIVAGTLARSLDPPSGASVEVRLERPVPLVNELTLTVDTGCARLELSGTTLATATAVETTPVAPPHVTAEEAIETTPVVPLSTHPAPGCFVCGPANAAGLNLQPGRLPARPLVATVWSPSARFGTADGLLPPPLVWAALDCPSWYGGAGGRPALLGTVRARQLAPVPVDAPVVVTGWRIGGTDRKTYAGSALCTTAGEPLAVATSIWIHPKEYQP
jgi:hypothetical protein